MPHVALASQEIINPTKNDTYIDNLLVSEELDFYETHNDLFIYEDEYFDDFEEVIHLDGTQVEVYEEILPQQRGLIAKLALVSGRWVIRWGSQTFRAVPASTVANALRNFSGQTYRIGNHTFRLTNARMRYAITRHHPKFWDGSRKASQTFFNPNLSLANTRNIVTNVLNQNRNILIQRGTSSVFQIHGTVNGVRYTVGINNGSVSTVFPR